MPYQNAARPDASADRCDQLELIGLSPLMRRTEGRTEIRVGLVDGPMMLDHSGLDNSHIEAISGSAACATESVACVHGTFVAGILVAKRNSGAPAICPECFACRRRASS